MSGGKLASGLQNLHLHLHAKVREGVKKMYVFKGFVINCAWVGVKSPKLSRCSFVFTCLYCILGNFRQYICQFYEREKCS